MLWHPDVLKSSKGQEYYGLGWDIMQAKEEFAFGKKHHFYAAHTGGSVGASSCLLIYPREKCDETKDRPQGVVVAILTNFYGVSVKDLAIKVAQLFETLHPHEYAYRVRKIEEC